MTDNKPLNFAQRDLFEMLGLRRGWYLRLIRGERGQMTRTLLFGDLAEAIRLNTPLDVALELIAQEHQGVELPFAALIFPFSQSLAMADPAQLVKVLAGYLLPLVRQGFSLSEAMARMGRAFSPQEIQIVAAGEQNGYLPRALQRLADYRQTDLRLYQIQQYLMYPLMVATLAAVIISTILVFIIPKFQAMFMQLGGELPRPTKTLIHASGLMVHKFYLLILAGCVCWVILRLASAQLARRTGLPLSCYIPLYGRLHRTVTEARWLAALTLHLEAGRRADEALRQAGAICGGSLARRSFEAADLVERGHAIGEACQRCRVLEHWVNHRLHLIDWRGNFIEAARGIVEDADRRATEALERFGKRAEIFSVVTVGLLVAFMVIAIYLPLFNIPRLIKGGE